MILMPGTVLMAAIPHSARLFIFILLGAIGCSIPFIPLFSLQPITPILVTTCLLVYFSISASQLTRLRLKEFMQHFDKPNLSVIELSYNDKEFNHLASQINLLLRTLERKGHLIQSCSQETRYTATELQNSSNDVADGAQEEYLALDALAATSEEMSTTINDIASRIKLTSDVANRTRLQSEEGQTALDVLKRHMETIASTVESNQQQMKELIKATEDIGSFVTTIGKITEQINLLSLNAAIESARAGEAGRGFAVVANEVRTLASNTEQATQDINHLVGSIVTQVSASEKTSLALIEFTRSATDSSTEVTKSLTSIYQAAQSTQEEIALSTELISEFSLANEQMCERLQNIAAVSEKHSQASKDTKDMVKYLEWLSSRLEQKELQS
ncbi:methyl-accepting chemotaxis protein [Marinomonas transparens]|uniref:Methyl-accepting transducer domain-containing protein n=1 Tax=Marinomonas transparens TaxID=2795388 RepID=A0A934JUE7_9GAMM|nr:methyl-accepting chemotaxis protein [Marinomonas transparens]MBJ7538521.1 hypothetical protein [Marinomonas transparens]